MLHQNNLKFLQPKQTFVNNIILLHQNNNNDELNLIILSEIKKYVAYDFISLLELSESNELIRYYCYLDQAEYINFWNELLISGKALTLLKRNSDLNLIPQKNIHSLDLIKAYFWFTKSYHLWKKTSLPALLETSCLDFIQEAISYGSYQAGCLLLDIFLKFEKEEITSPLEFTTVEEQLLQLADLNQAPGYMQLAKFYYQQAKYQQCYDCAAKALALLPESTNEIHNTGCNENQIKEIIIDLRELSLEQLNKQRVNTLIFLTC